MIHPVDDELRDEIARFRLVYTCERCVEFDPERQACSFGYPTAPHRARDLAEATELVFCKVFELAE